MSGAAALSAAKRRRGGSGAPANSAAAAAPSSAQARSQAQGQAQGARVTPIQMLQQHNIRIAKLEAANTNTATATTGTNIEGVSQELMKRMDTLETSVADVVASKNNGNGNGEQTHTLAVEPKEDLEFFRKKTILLEKQISELKQMMLKIQTFAMETSMSLMKYKNGIDIKEQEPIGIGDGTEDGTEDEPEDGPITPTNEEANHHTDDTTKDTLA